MSITELAISRNRVTFVVLLSLFLGGVFSFQSLSRNLDPGFLIRVAVVTVVFPGASAERVEDLATSKIEEVVMEIPELDFVRSESYTGMAQIYVNVKEQYTDLRPIWDSLRRKVERVQPDLPAGVVSVQVDDEFGDVYGVVVGLTGDGYNYSELKTIADQVKDAMIQLPEVAKVDLIGEQEERVYVEYNNARLAELGISTAMLSQTLASRNILISGGDIVVDDERISLEPTGNFESVEQLGNTVIKIPGAKEVVYLKDIVDIERGYTDPPSSIAHASGTPGLVLAVSMKDGGNYIRLGHQVDALLNSLNAQYPIGVEFSILYFLPKDITRTVNEFNMSLLQSVMIVIVVMLFFLGFRTGLIVGSLIPSAILFAFFVMGIFDIGLDQMSLSALIISLGLLVDNAIVVTESTLVRLQRGESSLDAALGSAKELTVPLLTSSLTTGAAFLPIYLADSAVGEYCAPLFKVVGITLLCSWVLSITMIPLLCTLFLKVDKTSPEESAKVYEQGFYLMYRKVISALIRRRWLSIAGVLAMFYGGITLLGFVPNIFFPASDQTTFQINISLPEGTNIRETEKVVKQLEQYMVREHKINESRPLGLEAWQTYISTGGPRFTLSYDPPAPKAENAVLVVNANDYERMLVIIPKIDDYLLNQFPGISYTVKTLGAGPSTDYPIEVRLAGSDTQILFGLAESVKNKLREIPEVALVNDNWGARTKKILVNIDQTRAHRAGVTNEDIARSLQTGLSGIEITQYREGDTVIPVVLRSVAADRQDIGKLESMNVFIQSSGVSVPLSQVADIEVVWEPNIVIRRDKQREITVRARLRYGALASPVNKEMAQWLSDYSRDWGVGFSYEFGGEAESSDEANASIMAQLGTAGLIIILLMVAQFNSIRRPAIIIMTIPLGIIGVAIGLFVTQAPLGFMTFLGIVSLSGIIINNAIVLIDRIDTETQVTGLGAYEAVLSACVQRLRPILLTTATTMLGLMPLWLGGSAMFVSMAIAIIFGLAFATILTLGVVPVLYAILFRVYEGQEA